MLIYHRSVLPRCISALSATNNLALILRICVSLSVTSVQVPPNSTMHSVTVDIAQVNDMPSFELALSEVIANEGNGTATDTYRVHNILERITAGM